MGSLPKLDGARFCLEIAESPASRSLATALWRARFARGLLRLIKYRKRNVDPFAT